MTNTVDTTAKLIQSVRRHRGMAGLSQQQLADRIGVPRRTIDEIEMGYTVPGVDIALEIARELRIPVTSLFTLKGGTP